MRQLQISLRLLKLDERVQEMVMEGKLSNGHARAIIGIEDGDQQYQVAQKIFGRADECP